jgi:hypothetical protein
VTQTTITLGLTVMGAAVANSMFLN